MKKIGAIALALGMLVGACGGGDVGKAKELRDKMCACKDKACTEAVEKEVDAWGKSMEGKFKDPKDIPAEMMTVMAEIMSCQAKAEGGATP